MHIGFDISQTGSAKAGCGFFAHAMIETMLGSASRHRFSLFPSFGDFFFDPLMPLGNPYPGRGARYGPRHLTRAAAARFWNAPDLETRLGSPGLVHSNNFWCPEGLASCRLVYTCYDLGFMVDPGWTTEANRIGCFEGMYRAAAFADWIVAISNATRDHFLRVFPHFPAERVRVINPVSRFDAAMAPGRRPAGLADLAAGRFWLSVGTIEPRKNHFMLADAYARYRERGGPAMPLVLAGGRGWLMEGFKAHLQSLGIENDVRITGYVSDAELVWLYGNCHAHLFPSRFEGFGLPVLEGLQLGAATLASSSSSIPEATGGAAVLLPPDEPEAWAGEMLLLARDAQRRETLRRSAGEHARQIDRTRGATHMLALYEEAVAAPKRVALGGGGI